MKARIYTDEKYKPEYGKPAYHIIVEAENTLESLAIDDLRTKRNEDTIELTVDVLGFGMFIPYKSKEDSK
jgi:hypothetical protein